MIIQQRPFPTQKFSELIRKWPVRFGEIPPVCTISAVRRPVFLEASRKQIAELLGVKSSEILFTSGGTESDNWVIKGVAFEKERYGKHIIVSDIEHPAVKESAKWLSQHGFEVSYAPVTADGFVDIDQLATLLRPDTILVSIMAVNNEIGSNQPIKAISDLLANKPAITFHVDAVQAIGKIPTKDLFDRACGFRQLFWSQIPFSARCGIYL